MTTGYEAMRDHMIRRIDTYGRRREPGAISAMTESIPLAELIRLRDVYAAKCKPPVCDLCKDTGNIQLTGMSSGYQGEPFVTCPACKGKTARPMTAAPDAAQYEPQDISGIAF